MKIDNFKSEKRANKKWIAATVRWEDCDHEDYEVYFETDEKFAEDFDSNPHAALSAYLIPALRHGEERILIDAEVCPEFKEGTNIAMNWMSHWFYGGDRKPVRIEAKTRSKIPTPQRPSRAGLLFSGGVDSMASLRTNRLNFPLEHPGSIKDGIFAYGFDVRFEESFDDMVGSLSDIVEETGITLLTFSSNLFSHYLSLELDLLINKPEGVWPYQYQGGALAGAAHLFTKRLDAVKIASTFDIANLRPFGNHPMIEPNFSSHDMQISHDGVTLSRLDKVKLIADWDVGLQSIRVCNQLSLWDGTSQSFRERNPIKPGELNCGKCTKCVVTMLSLLVAGALHKASTFPSNDISADLIRSSFYPTEQNICEYVDLIAPLTEIGRDDLARAIERVVAIYLDREPGLKGWAKRFDRKYLNNNLAEFKRAIHKHAVRS
ncbi:MAG: hypothetical protein L6290_06485 [Thermodesulfovibrionales bacterium]|nr:hypothetical protein [Thermodesulfovibrionales bacterium]